MVETCISSAGPFAGCCTLHTEEIRFGGGFVMRGDDLDNPRLRSSITCYLFSPLAIKSVTNPTGLPPFNIDTLENKDQYSFGDTDLHISMHTVLGLV